MACGVDGGSCLASGHVGVQEATTKKTPNNAARASVYTGIRVMYSYALMNTVALICNIYMYTYISTHGWHARFVCSVCEVPFFFSLTLSLSVSTRLYDISSRSYHAT